MAKLADPFFPDAVKNYRRDLDNCDGILFDYLQSRIILAAGLAKAKHRVGLPIEDAEREAQVRESAVKFVREHGCPLITEQDITEFIDVIIKITKRAEERELANIDKEKITKLSK